MLVMTSRDRDGKSKGRAKTREIKVWVQTKFYKNERQRAMRGGDRFYEPNRVQKDWVAERNAVRTPVVRSNVKD